MLTECERLSGMSLEKEIENAVLSQTAELMSVISSCNLILMGSLFDHHPSIVFETFRQIRFSVEHAEALQAVLLTRAGISWDVMSSGESNVSRQAMHRRLANNGEFYFEMAQQYPLQARESIEKAVLTVPPKPKKLFAYCKNKTNEIMKSRVHPQWWVNMKHWV